MNIQQLRKLKKSTLDHARLCRVPIDLDEINLGYLIPIGDWILGEKDVVRQISEWRRHAMRMYLVQFESTPAKTITYLQTRSLGEDDRILFMIEANGEFIGHVGLSKVTETSAEVDNLMRGVSGGPAELMEASERALVEWAFSTLGLRSLHLRVLSYNFMAKALHENLGFVTISRLPLKRDEIADSTVLVECMADEANVTYTCDVMVLDQEAYVRREHG